MIEEFKLDPNDSSDEIEQFQLKLETTKSELLVAYFFATWCGPCKALSPMISKLMEEDLKEKSVSILKIDLDEYADLGKDLRILKLPALILFKNAEEKQRLFGVKSREELKEKFLALLEPVSQT